jgi:Rrf2 family transcriptional regulator, cysteine metabolism repressor
MKLSAKAEYACVAMVELAIRHQRNLPTSLKVIAENYRISQPFLMQIFMQLKGAGLVQSIRGAAGGYQLVRPPEEIRLAEIVDVIDGPARESSALDALPDTALMRTLRKTWIEMQRAARDVLSDITLADLARRTRETSLDFQI